MEKEPLCLFSAYEPHFDLDSATNPFINKISKTIEAMYTVSGYDIKELIIL